MMTTGTARSRWAFAEVTVAMAVAGSSVVPAKVAEAHLPLFVVSFMSFVAALVVVLPLQLTRLDELRGLYGRELLLMVLQALFGMVLFRVFLLLGLARTSAVDAGIIMGCGPAATIGLGAAVFRERLSGRRVASLILSIAGIASLYLSGGGALGGGASGGLLDGGVNPAANLGGFAGAATALNLRRITGDLLILCAIVSESLLTIFRKLARHAASAITNTTVLTLASALMTLPLAAVAFTHRASVEFTPAVWVSLVYYGSFVTVVGYLLWGDGALRLPAGMVGIATGAMPLSSALLSTLLLGEPFGLGQLIGCSFVVGSILLSSRG